MIEKSAFAFKRASIIRTVTIISIWHTYRMSNFYGKLKLTTQKSVYLNVRLVGFRIFNITSRPNGHLLL